MRRRMPHETELNRREQFAQTLRTHASQRTHLQITDALRHVYFGSNGSNDVVSFLRTSNTKTGNVDIKAVLQWIIANNSTKYGAFTASWTLDQVQFGYEITSNGTTQAFVTNSFSVTSS